MTANIPLACTLSADERRARGQEIGELFGRATGREELPDGYAVAFPGGDETAHALLTFVIAERACCPFFTFELSFPSPHAEIWLRIRGEAAEAKEMIRADFAAGGGDAVP